MPKSVAVIVTGPGREPKRSTGTYHSTQMGGLNVRVMLPSSFGSDSDDIYLEFSEPQGRGRPRRIIGNLSIALPIYEGNGYSRFEDTPVRPAWKGEEPPPEVDIYECCPPRVTGEGGHHYRGSSLFAKHWPFRKGPWWDAERVRHDA